VYSFFKENKQWGIFGTLFIVLGILSQVLIDVQINDWYGLFYGQIEQSLKNPNSVALSDFYWTLGKFCLLAGTWVVSAVIVKFFASHWVFRWRTSMVGHYHKNFGKSKIEGASQRVQEDTLKFARLVEDLGQNFVEAIITLFLFFPILYTLGGNLANGAGASILIWTAVGCALIGTVFLAVVGRKLPHLEYDIQAEEAAYRKALVAYEDTDSNQSVLTGLYEEVRKVHYRSYFHYLYFNASRWSFLQGMVIVPYVVMAPSIVTGLLTLGLVRQIGHAFTQVSRNLQYLVQSWPQIVELLSVYKRLREYDKLS
jgi:peptide/bleomycin uptake transporter